MYNNITILLIITFNLKRNSIVMLYATMYRDIYNNVLLYIITK